MGSVIKGGVGGYVYVNSFDTDEPVMKTIYGKNPNARKLEEIRRSNDRAAQAMELAKQSLTDESEVQSDSVPPVSEDSVSAEEARVEREKLIAEYEAIRTKYEKESEEFVLHARAKATEIYDKTREIALQTVEEAKAEAEKILSDAKIRGEKLAEEMKKQAYAEGEKKGYDEGYVKALKKCKETLLDLKTLSEQVSSEKSELLMKYERQLFDTIFEIAQKVTLGALEQKEKGIITRMIREAGKKFKLSKNVRLTLSKLDVSEIAEIDEQLLKDVFKGSENVEIELLDDAPQGTLLIDDGNEITDASVMTQLKMVEQLGKGKYRDTSITDMIRESAADSKSRRGGKKKSAAKTEGTAENETGNDQTEDAGADDSAVPDVVYTTGSVTDNTVAEDSLEKAIENS